MARITVELPEDLKRKLKAKLVLQGMTIKDWILKHIESYLEEKSERKKQGRVG